MAAPEMVAKVALAMAATRLAKAAMERPRPAVPVQSAPWVAVLQTEMLPMAVLRMALTPPVPAAQAVMHRMRQVLPVLVPRVVKVALAATPVEQQAVPVAMAAPAATRLAAVVAQVATRLAAMAVQVVARLAALAVPAATQRAARAAEAAIQRVARAAARAA